MKFKRMLIGIITSALALSTVFASTFSVSAKGIAVPPNVPASITSTAQTSEKVSVNPTKSGQPITLNSSKTSTLPLKTTSVASSFAATDEVEANASTDSSAIYGATGTLTSASPTEFYTFSTTSDAATGVELNTSNTSYEFALWWEDTSTSEYYQLGVYTSLNSVLTFSDLPAGNYAIEILSASTYGDSYTFTLNATNPINPSQTVNNNIAHLAYGYSDGSIYSNGTRVYSPSGDTSNLEWNYVYYRSWSGGDFEQKQRVFSVVVDTFKPVLYATQYYSAGNGYVGTISSDNVLLIPVGAGSHYSYWESEFNDNEFVIDNHYDVYGNLTPETLTVDPGYLAYDLNTNSVIDFYSYLNYYYGCDHSIVSYKPLPTLTITKSLS